MKTKNHRPLWTVASAKTRWKATPSPVLPSIRGHRPIWNLTGVFLMCTLCVPYVYLISIRGHRPIWNLIGVFLMCSLCVPYVFLMCCDIYNLFHFYVFRYRIFSTSTCTCVPNVFLLCSLWVLYIQSVPLPPVHVCVCVCVCCQVSGRTGSL